MITIISNGGTWAGEPPDSIDQLLAVLAREPLDPRFEPYGNFVIHEHPPVVRFWGNFFHVSHVFAIDTDEPALIARLTEAIRANQQTAAYAAARRARAYATGFNGFMQVRR